MNDTNLVWFILIATVVGGMAIYGTVVFIDAHVFPLDSSSETDKLWALHNQIHELDKEFQVIRDKCYTLNTKYWCETKWDRNTDDYMELYKEWRIAVIRGMS